DTSLETSVGCEADDCHGKEALTPLCLRTPADRAVPSSLSQSSKCLAWRFIRCLRYRIATRPRLARRNLKKYCVRALSLSNTAQLGSYRRANDSPSGGLRQPKSVPPNPETTGHQKPASESDRAPRARAARRNRSNRPAFRLPRSPFQGSRHLCCLTEVLLRY